MRPSDTLLEIEEGEAFEVCWCEVNRPPVRFSYGVIKVLKYPCRGFPETRIHTHTNRRLCPPPCRPPVGGLCWTRPSDMRAS